MVKILQNDTETCSMNHKCGFAAIIGLPNAGKSTLMNRYLKEKVSIVTPKPQTTRNNVTSILSSEKFQIIFIDTPGMLKPRYKMQEVMASFVRNAVQEADLILLIIDAAEFRDKHHHAIVSFADKLKAQQVIVALNKIDMVKKSNLLPIIQRTNEIFPDIEIIPISAIEGDGTDDLFKVILEKLPEGPKLYPDDIISSEPERFFVSELIREAIFLTMEKEIPYSSAVIIEQYIEKEKIIVIHALILVEKKSQKPIIIGKNGATIKRIGTKARLGIEEFLGRKVFLELRVKVRKDWRKKDVFLREVGLLKR